MEEWKSNLKMGSADDLLTFMDLLDLDEELVDTRLKTIMSRESFTKKHLISAIQLLKYKYLINIQEDTECDNVEECDFIARLFAKISNENIDYVCEIINIVLNLNKTSIISKCEHLIQQILADIELPTNDIANEDEKSIKTLLHLKLCDSILNALMKNGEKVSLLFLESALERVLLSSDEKLKIHFLTSTVPKLFEGTVGFNILDKIWNYLQQFKKEDKEKALKVLSCLSEYYVPVADSTGNMKFQSEIVNQYEFWDSLLNGMVSNDGSVRKVAVYLMKRAIDNLMTQKRDIRIHDEISTTFVWEHKNQKSLKQMWDNYFILIDSLEEKQSNIVLPSLQLFETLKKIPACWLNCAFNMGLRHDNLQIRLKCIEYCLQAKVYNEAEAQVLLEALNDINIYDNAKVCESLMKCLHHYFEDVHTFVHIFKAVPKVKWSPVPLYHISKVLATLKLKELTLVLNDIKISEIITEILKTPCNNIPVRKAVQVNISYFIGNCCKNLHWKHIVDIYTVFNTYVIDSSQDNPLLSFILNISLDNEAKKEFMKKLIHANIDLAALYFEHHPDNIDELLYIIDEKVRKINDVVNRQYSDKTECLKDVIFLIHLFKLSSKTNTALKATVNCIIAREYKSIIQYLLNLLACDVILSIEDINLLFKDLNTLSDTLNDVEARNILLQLYKSSLLFLRDKYTDIDKKVFSIHAIDVLSNNTVLNTHSKNEMLNLEQALYMMNNIEFKDNQNIEDNGRFRNSFYEKSCKLIFELLEYETTKKKNCKEILGFIEKVTECGGYGCLRWILKIMNEVLAIILDDDKTDFNVPQFVNRMWTELEELKSNNQYSPCMEQFVNLITQELLLRKSMYNNLIILYCSKIIEYGPLKNSPLFYLAKKLETMNITEDYGQIIYVLCEMLLFSPVPRKDQRILDNVAVEILNEPKYGLHNEKDDTYFNYQIQYLTISTLSKISHPEILETIVSFIITRVDDIFKNKPRYHGNSQVHRTLLISLQHLIFILDSKTVGSEKVLSWTFELFGRLPHQPSVRICLEWFIALNLYEKGKKLDEKVTAMMTSNNIPLTSQFMILYWVIKHKILNKTYEKKEYEFVMDFLLSHTMGQMFNIRLNAQFLATRLAEINHEDSEKYSFIIQVIGKTFLESSKDKNFVKLNEDLFVNDFDIIGNLTPCFVYWFLPKYCDIGRNEIVDQSYLKQIMEGIDEIVKNKNSSEIIKKEWMLKHKTTSEVLKLTLNKISETVKTDENADLSGTIQKKYIPWKNMSDIETYEVGKKRENPGELIVVASLIDKLPNLGGMARTSEVFGVKTYVIDSIRHLQDKQFQGLSVSAERWVNVEEVRPGPPLKEYLMRKKTQGYSIIAAEQTSSSCPLQTFKFPKKSLLLLGHEKDGIPCDLLPIMDFCVEIPQQGFVRSLNVHVTAAIFVWEYTRQNVL